jgi:hypothetical protein
MIDVEVCHPLHIVTCDVSCFWKIDLAQLLSLYFAPGPLIFLHCKAWGLCFSFGFDPWLNVVVDIMEVKCNPLLKFILKLWAQRSCYCDKELFQFYCTISWAIAFCGLLKWAHYICYQLGRNAETSFKSCQKVSSIFMVRLCIRPWYILIVPCIVVGYEASLVIVYIIRHLEKIPTVFGGHLFVSKYPFLKGEGIFMHTYKHKVPPNLKE